MEDSDNSSLTPSVVAIEQSIATRAEGQGTPLQRIKKTCLIQLSAIGRIMTIPESQKSSRSRTNQLFQRVKPRMAEVEIGLATDISSPVEFPRWSWKTKKDAEQELAKMSLMPL